MAKKVFTIYFSGSVNGDAFEGWAPGKDDNGENVIVEVTEHNPFRFTIECEGGALKLEVSQHIDRAMNLFIALLNADNTQEYLDRERHEATK